jgi:nucleoside diphosphate kinase
MSAEQLAYAIITPYSLNKSRTGGILARLISRTGLELAGARMFAPSNELVQKYSSILVSSDNAQDRRVQTLIRDYVSKYFVADSKTQRPRRVMVLLFRGEDAVEKIRGAVGNFSLNRVGGETIRDTYGDLVFDEHDNVRYFEPAVLAAPNVQEAAVKLKLWASYSDSDGGILTNIISYPPNVKSQRTLVLIKPDNFRFSTGRPGNVIDFFSRTGLFIVGIKLHCMSVAEAMEFYGPVREVLREKLTGVAATKARTALENEFKFDLPQPVVDKLGGLLGPLMGDNQFENIIKFMSGSTPSTCDPKLREKPGTEKCIALVYEGENAVQKIREVLGPTDPSKAPPGSIRREFGQTIMVNAAHASDSEDNAKREMGIIGISRNNFRDVVESFYGKA